jgi:hypothetical protein
LKAGIIRRTQLRLCVVAKQQPTPGERLRFRRLAIRMSLREVHQASIALAAKLGNREFLLPASRLHEIEVKGIVPSIFRLYTLSRVYGVKLADMLRWYGVPSR